MKEISLKGHFKIMNHSFQGGKELPFLGINDSPEVSLGLRKLTITYTSSHLVWILLPFPNLRYNCMHLYMRKCVCA